MEWILILCMYAGMLSKGDSVALTNIHGFATEQECIQAGNKSKKLAEGTFKEVRFICVPCSKK